MRAELVSDARAQLGEGPLWDARTNELLWVDILPGIVHRFDDFDEALSRANAVPFGLSAAVFTSSLATATRFQREAQAGLIHVNSQTAGADVHVPFGGIKASGFGPHEQGRAAMEFYTEVVTVYHDA